MSEAVQISSFDCTSLLFQYGGSIQQGQLLHYAAQRKSMDRLQVVNLILSKNPPIDEVKFQSTPGIYTMYAAFGLGTPISYATREGHLDVVKRLVEKGADPHIVDSRGQLPVDAAKSRGHMDVVTYLQSLPDPKDAKLVLQ
jgi:ankyrin repeat protein